MKDVRPAKKAKQDDGVNIDADSDFSVDDPSSDEDNENKSSAKEIVKESATSNRIQDTKTKMDKDVKTELTPKEKIEEKKLKPKIDIWKKRTVGEIFEQALKRYYERKSCRGY